ncbi:MAG: SOS response-associated peptidase [Methanoregulaceae archaeon]|nr:SOS response-associated peptidase [Methanoregulaceae archaeon]
MCGRFTITLTVGLAERFAVTHATLQPIPRFNIAPSQPVPVVTTGDDGERALSEMIWGLVPHWARDPSAVGHAINARAETLEERPSFRDPFLRHRCLVPANGFYEWKKEGKRREPYYIHRKDDKIFAIAGLYDIWRGADGAEFRSFVIVTTEPNAVVSRYPDRMPAILRPDDEKRWLSPGRLAPETAREILSPYPAEFLEAYRVSTRVNDPATEGSDLIRRMPDSTLGV